MLEQANDQACRAKQIRNGRFQPLVLEFLEYLRRSGVSESSLPNFPGPAQHFLVWIDENSIDLSIVDVEVVRRFLTHDCSCPRPSGARYQNHHMHSRGFKARVLWFMRFLEDTKRVQHSTSLEDGLQRIDDFADYLGGLGYAPETIVHYRYSCRHFVLWLHQHRIALPTIDDCIVQRFVEHDCICPGMFKHNAKRNQDYVSEIQRFVRFLVTINVITPAATSGDNQGNSRFSAFHDWMRRHRGTGERTILAHVRTITALLPQLGADPSRYDAALINRVMLQNLESTSRDRAQKTCGSLRMYLRFLAATGVCSPALIGAIPRIPQWQLSALPRYILNDDVERVIASCDTTTARGLRDRAILLLLARLALRAGDVANLDLHDIDWDNALIHVAGKTRRTVALPLPQDAGDALLAYIEHARPAVDSSKIFIRVIAPFKPFASSSPIAIIVRDALKRAEVENANLRGAYLLRHSAATNMLRSGATLDAVGALLRHQSPKTTAIYAKVDTCMLSQVAQPWIGSVSCR